MHKTTLNNIFQFKDLALVYSELPEIGCHS